MKTQQYFFKITATYSDKNQLYKELREFVQQWDNTLFTTPEAFKDFGYQLGKQCAKLNQKHHRCKPITIETGDHPYQDNDGKNIHVSGSWFASFYPVKQICN